MEKRTPVAQYIMEEVMKDVANTTADKNVWELVESDLKWGLSDQEVAMYYRQKGMPLPQMRLISEVLKMDYGMELMELYNNDRKNIGKLSLAKEFLEKGIPFEDIMTGFWECQTSHDLRILYSNILTQMQEIMVMEPPHMNAEEEERLMQIVSDISSNIEKIKFNEARYERLNEILSTLCTQKEDQMVEENLVELVDTLTTENVKVTEENKNMKELNENLSNEIADLRSENEELKKKLELAKSENTEISSQLENQQTTLNDATALTAKHRNELDAKEKEIADLNGQVKVLEEKLVGKEAVISELRELFQKKRNDSEDAKGESPLQNTEEVKAAEIDSNERENEQEVVQPVKKTLKVQNHISADQYISENRKKGEYKTVQVENMGVPVFYTMTIQENGTLIQRSELDVMERKNHGFATILGKLGFKKKSRQDIVARVAREEFTPEQMEQIKNALEMGLSERQLDLLVNHHMSPARMIGFIRVAVAENNLKERGVIADGSGN